MLNILYHIWMLSSPFALGTIAYIIAAIFLAPNVVIGAVGYGLYFTIHMILSQYVRQPSTWT